METPINDCARNLMQLAYNNGGYIRLAAIIESEMVKSRLEPLPYVHYKKSNSLLWTDEEKQIIIDTIELAPMDVLPLLPKRTIQAVYKRRYFCLKEIYASQNNHGQQ